MIINIETIRKIIGKLSTKQAPNALSAILAINKFGPAKGLAKPHRLAQFLAQELHESGAYLYDRELWGPTAAQKRYEGRKDLGNIHKGDGSKFRGRGPIQVTGRHNYTAFTAWAKKLLSDAPDFTQDPAKLNTDPWEGLSAIWYWDEGNPEGKSLNRYADQGDIEMITKRVNGGLNGYQDRINWYVKASLVLLGYEPDDVVKFQKASKLPADGVAGPKTRAALHAALCALSSSDDAEPTSKAPVVVEKPIQVEVPVPVKTEELDKPWYKDLMGQKEAAGTIIIPGMAALNGIDWRTVGVIALTCLILAGAYYIIRKRNASKQEAKAQAVNADAAEIKAAN